MMDVGSLAPHAVNSGLFIILFFMLKHELHDIKSRIVRIENTFFTKGSDER